MGTGSWVPAALETLFKDSYVDCAHHDEQGRL